MAEDAETPVVEEDQAALDPVEQSPEPQPDADMETDVVLLALHIVLVARVWLCGWSVCVVSCVGRVGS